MQEVTFTVSKANVYNEVAKTSSYTGVKMLGDADAYDRIFTTDDDRMMLERFWLEACNAVTDLFKPFIVSVDEQPESHCIELERNYNAVLDLPSSYDIRLNDSVSGSLFSFFTNLIIAKWYEFTNKGEAEKYATTAGVMLDDVRAKIYYKRKPRRAEPVL